MAFTVYEIRGKEKGKFDELLLKLLQIGVIQFITIILGTIVQYVV